MDMKKNLLTVSRLFKCRKGLSGTKSPIEGKADYSKFLDDNFDVKEWVNSAFKAQKDGNKDQYATTLVMKLQMFIQEVNNVIEESCQQAINNLPRVSRELEAVRQEASMLQEQMKTVKHDIEKVEQDTSQSMQTLLKLDTIKTRMKAASDALQEADNWTTLSADVDEVFESKDIQAIAQKLVGMQQSLQVLTDVPDYAERCQYLESLKNQLETMLSTQVVTAFSTQSLDAAQMYVKIFTDINRLPQLYKYYHKCQKNVLLQHWSKLQREQSDETLIEWMSVLYNELLSTWHAQVKWCGNVFQEPVPIVVELLSETLQSLDPSMSSSIATYLHNKETPLEHLLDLKQSSERFAKSIEVAIGTSLSGNLQIACVEKLASAIYDPYKVYVNKFGDFVQDTLSESLNSIPLDHEDVLDCVRLLGESVEKLFAAANAANTRCISFTNGCGYNSLISALHIYFKNYIDEFKRVLTNIREKCNMSFSSVESEDWSLFQNSLRIIQTCGDLILHMRELDENLVISILRTVEKYCPPSSPVRHEQNLMFDMKINPFANYKALLLDKAEERRNLEELITRLEEGNSPTVMEDIQEEMYRLSQLVHQFGFDIVFQPLQSQLADVPTMQIWTSRSAGGALTSDLPTFSLSPQEYITRIGQYLMTLPQHLEPFILEDNPTLATALKYGKLPFTTDRTDMPEHLADLWLESVAKGTMQRYTDEILKIPKLTEYSSKQLFTDIDYLFNVLDDLGLQSSDTLKNVAALLQAPPDEYSDMAENMPQRLTHAISNMRDIELE